MSPSARYHARRRTEVLDILGGACEECQQRDARLEVHHVNGDGHLERKAYGHAEFITRILQDRRFPEFGPIVALCPPCHKAA